MKKRQLALLERLEAWFEAQGHATAEDAARALFLPREAAEAVVRLGVDDGRLVMLGSEVVTAGAFKRDCERLRAAVGDRPFAPRELREALGVSRGWAERFAVALEVNGLLAREQGGWRLKQRE